MSSYSSEKLRKIGIVLFFFVMILLNALVSAEDVFLNHAETKEAERIKKFASKVKSDTKVSGWDRLIC